MYEYLDSITPYIERSKARRDTMQTEINNIISSRASNPRLTSVKAPVGTTPGSSPSGGGKMPKVGGTPKHGKITLRELMSRIAEKESGGNYSALGEPISTGDRAYGKYQIMGSNIPSWTQDVLGRSMSPAEFLANKRAQDRVAKAKLKGYYKRYGAGGAAAAWYGGPSVASQWKDYKAANYSPAGTEYPSIFDYVRDILKG